MFKHINKCFPRSIATVIVSKVKFAITNIYILRYSSRLAYNF